MYGHAFGMFAPNRRHAGGMTIIEANMPKACPYISGVYPFVGRNAKTTAAIMQMKAQTWFQCRCCPWNTSMAMTVKTVSEMHSCMILSWNSEKGPPLPSNPIRLAGIMNVYSRNASPHDRSMIDMRGQFLMRPASDSRRLPYHANVMKTFDTTSINTVSNAVFIMEFGLRLQS